MYLLGYVVNNLLSHFFLFFFTDTHENYGKFGKQWR